MLVWAREMDWMIMKRSQRRNLSKFSLVCTQLCNLCVVIISHNPSFLLRTCTLFIKGRGFIFLACPILARKNVASLGLIPQTGLWYFRPPGLYVSKNVGEHDMISLRLRNPTLIGHLLYTTSWSWVLDLQRQILNISKVHYSFIIINPVGWQSGVEVFSLSKPWQFSWS